MKLLIALIILTIFACAALASHQAKPFPLLIDAKPGNWPTNARYSLNRPHVMMCRPMVVTVGPDDSKPITRT